ncbi:ATP-binding protein [Methylocella silvestris]|uniref:C4-dicarboxylate transport sensor protein DctB n=1 Tax=Methylocella silvestris TaxID=199596 RepID=A0A2J7TBR8_METSI|nr:ATP-binding protein [Methylocella silvestris]PNG24207.1 sensor histidine kinase [Methylocella silvestris]
MERNVAEVEKARWAIILPALLGALVVGVVAGAVVAAGDIAVKIRSERIIQRGRIEAERYAALLASELHRFDYLPELLRYHPSIISVLQAPSDPSRIAAANRYLEEVNRAAGSTTLYLLDLKGVTIASSNWSEPTSFVGRDLSYRPYFVNALQTGSDRFYGIGTNSGTPGYYFSRALRAEGAPGGVGVVKVNLERFEVHPFTMLGDVIITDQNGVIVLSSRPQWRYKTMTQLSEAVLANLNNARQYENVPLTPVGIVTEESFGGGAAIVSLPSDAPGTGRVRFLAQELHLDGSDWEIAILSDLSDVLIVKRWTQLIVALVGLALILFVLFLLQRRRAIQLELAAKEFLARANIELEHQVKRRTQALVAANETLRATQDELVHSAKLAAIGQFAAGVTHELSQPLAAIRALADNAEVLIKRSEIDTANGNLQMIGELVERMTKITGQLKLFARKDWIEVQAVSVNCSVNNVLRMLDEKIRQVGAKVVFSEEGGDLLVEADPGGLDQILINLTSNAIDAVSGASAPLVEIGARRVDRTTIISIRDNGAGLTEVVLSRLFEPFFTTKTAGAGLGLGLAISEGIARKYGGSLQASNRPGQGAEFLVILPSHRKMAEADNE